MSFIAEWKVLVTYFDGVDLKIKSVKARDKAEASVLRYNYYLNPDVVFADVFWGNTLIDPVDL